MKVRILAVSGSSRRESLNGKLLEVAVRGARDVGADVTTVRLADLQLPLYDADLESDHGLPAGAVELQCLIERHDAMLIATPEHNGGYTVQLKNAIDWASRPRPDGSPGIDLFTRKSAALISASPGKLGGIRSQIAFRMVLEKLGVVVIPESFALSLAHEAFGVDGRLADERTSRLVSVVGVALCRTATRFTQA